MINPNEINTKNGLWIPNNSPRTKETHIKWFGETMFDIEDSLNQLSNTFDERKLRIEARTLSIALRKLLHEQLVNISLRKPRFHKISKPTDTDPSIQNHHMKYQYRRTPTQRILWTAESDTRIEIHSLPGLLHDKISDWHIDHDLFNASREPHLSLGQWLKQTLFKVIKDQETETFSLYEVLQYVANTEGAHTDTGETSKNRMSKSRVGQFMEAIGGQDTFTYPHMVVMLVATYLRNRHAQGIAERPEEWEKYINKNIVPELKWYKYLTGGRGLPYKIALPATGISLDEPEQPPPAYQNSHWIITSAVE